MSRYLDDGEAADADDGQADDGYQEPATTVMQHGGGEVSTFGLAAGWLSVGEAEAWSTPPGGHAPRLRSVRCPHALG